MHFNTLFNPSSIAIIGASTRPGSVSNDVIRNLHTQGYKGHIYPINPKGEPILGMTTYTSMAEIGKPVDLAVIIIPAPKVPQALREVGQAGTHAVVVISAGFKEAGPEGAALESELQTIAKEYDITLIGPNCLGIINPHSNLNISFAKVPARTGNVAFVSQSGALCASVLDYAEEYGIGFSKFASVGNKACIDEVEFLEYLAHDEQTKVILLYIESLNGADRFISQVRTLTSGANRKPIIALKAGRTAAGASASASHTGALAGNDTAYDALFKQAGVIRVSTVEELFVYAAAFAHNGELKGNRIAIVTNAGGPGVLVADEVASNDLTLAVFNEDTQRILASGLPPAANMKNPVDVLGDAQSNRYETALNAIIADPGVDGIITILTPQSMTDVAQIAITVSNARAKGGKPLIASFMGAKSIYEGDAILQRHNVANMLFPESAAHAMAALYQFYNQTRATDLHTPTLNNVRKSEVGGILQRAKAEGRTFLPEAEALAVLDAYGLPLLKSTRIHTVSEAHALAESVNYPVALKIISKDIVHKTDVGGVKLHVAPHDIPESYESMLQVVSQKAPNAHLDGVLAMEMAPKDGFEFVIGVNKDPALGHMVMVGLGGVFVEVLKDVAFRLAPLTAQDVDEMLREVKASKLLKGVRGMDPLDRAALTECLLRISQLVTDFPQIQELDINPILVLPKEQGVRVLDGRIILNK